MIFSSADASNAFVTLCDATVTRGSRGTALDQGVILLVRGLTEPEAIREQKGIATGTQRPRSRRDGGRRPRHGPRRG